MSIITCIGSGNMGTALMKGAISGGAVNSEDVYFTDADFQKAKSAADSLKAKTLKTNTEAAEKGDFVFLAVKPQILANVLAEVTPILSKRVTHGNSPILVSMAAGYSIKKIKNLLPATCYLLPVIRMMPNTPALIGKGMIAYAASEEVSENKVEEFEKILKGAGVVDRVEEKYLDAVTGLSGSGPAFGYLFIESLADGGVRAGLPKEKALMYAVQTVLGAAEMVKQTGKTPQELIDMVTSPGGTTLAGLSALNDGAFKETVMEAVEAARMRSWELGNTKP